VCRQDRHDIQVGARHGPRLPIGAFTIAVGSGGSGYEHMLVTATAGASAPTPGP